VLLQLHKVGAGVEGAGGGAQRVGGACRRQAGRGWLGRASMWSELRVLEPGSSCLGQEERHEDEGRAQTME